MISHVVLFKPQAPLSPLQQQAILDALTTAASRCPTVRGCRVGRRILHGLPGYEAAMREDYEFALLLDFDDVEGLRAYLTHPDHARLGDVFTSGASAALAYDYEMMDLGTGGTEGTG